MWNTITELGFETSGCARGTWRWSLVLWGAFIAGLSGCVGTASETRQAPKPATELNFVQAEIIERYDKDGTWRPVPRRVILLGEPADRLGRYFPELSIEPQPSLFTAERMRFQITFARGDGQKSVIWINPRIDTWWDERSVYKLECAAADAVRDVAADGKEDPSLVTTLSPIVRAEIIDTEDGYGRIRRIPVKAIVTGKLATAIGAQFPEIGLKRHPQVAHGGGYRFKVIFTRENDERVEVFVVATLGEKWIWCEGHSYWELTPGVAYELVGQCRDAKEDPSTTMPSTTQP